MNIEADAAHALGWLENHTPGHHHTSTAPAAANINTSTPGEHMSLSADLHALATRLDAIGDDAITKAEAVTANPEANDIFTDIAHLAGLNVSPGLLGILGAGLKSLLAQFQPQATQQPAAESFTPAGPTVAGQA